MERDNSTEIENEMNRADVDNFKIVCKTFEQRMNDTIHSFEFF